MHIKYVLIKKFKSYRELSYMEPLYEGVNVVIGANGHGKSNLLDAIIFVLTDKYSNLRQEDKKLLIHEEPGEDTQQISVELIIDNKSRRFPVDKDTINITKIYHVNDNREEILINQKKLIKSDVYNLLESAGFCKQNPYYIIQQGKINTLINMNEFELFEQFAEVTGTKVYEEKKVESMYLLEEAKDNRNRIIKQREEINEYILRLETQCEDLSSFEKLETKKKACEFFIFNEKVADLQISIDILEERKSAQASSLQNLSANLNVIKEKISEKISVQSQLQKHIEGFKTKIKRCDEQINNIHQYTYKEEASLKMLNEKNKNRIEVKQQLEAEVKSLTQEKSKLNVDYIRVVQKLRDIDSEIDSIQKQFNDLSGRTDMILIKQSGESAFKSENERKTFLQNEIKKLASLKEEINSKIVDLNRSIKSDEDSHKALGKELENNDHETAASSVELKKVNDSLMEFKKRRVDYVNSMKKIDLDINELSDENESVKDSIKQLERLAPSFEVLQAVREIKQQSFPGCYGILMDLVTTDKKYKNAMDIFGKDKLYSLVVDSVQTADEIMEFNRKKGGPVIHIMPLEWNKDIKQYSYPTTDALPFMQFIQIKENPLLANNLKKEDLLPIINKVFGKSLLVKNYEVGMKVSKQYGLNCVTAENEIIYAGGFVTKVGYYDYKRQRCTIYDQIKENFEKLRISSESKTKLETERQSISNMETKILRENQTLLIKKSDLSNRLQELSKQQQSISEEMMNIKEIINSKKSNIDTLLQDKLATEQRMNNYSSILSTKNFSAPTESELEEVNQINKEKEQIEKKLIELEKAKNYIQQQKINLESRLNDQISKREIELKAQLSELTSHVPLTMSQTFESSEEKAVITDIENNLRDIQNLEKAKWKYKDEVERCEKEVDSMANDINIMKTELNKINEKINKNEAELKAVLLSLNDSNEKKNSLIKKIAGLGHIKPEEVDKFAKMKEKHLLVVQNESGIDVRDPDKKLNIVLEPIYSKLEGINRKMKKFEKINRFAIDDYRLFKEKREEVNEKLDDLQTKEDEILEVIRVLDEKKENAIQSTFEKVSRSFEFFFKELVPHGYASLSLESISGAGFSQSQRGSQVKAIYINVSFSGNPNSIQSMHQLSGGQKTAVAVALIFSLSKIDPPPFYILDEIDAALDPSMRTNLSKLISNLSQQNQYIISTFKPEILEVSDNIYQVKFSNKTSNLTKIAKEEAKKFIKDINI